MRSAVFASRNAKEVLRDPLNVAFGVGFPLVVLLLLSAIQANIPVSLFSIDRLAPGIAVFGLSFFSLFAGTLIAKDRVTSLLMRLFASPLTASDFILGYALPLLPIAMVQVLVCFIGAFVLGLPIGTNAFVAVVSLLPAAVLFIFIGLLAGTVFNDKQVGAVCGALLVNLSAWLSGTWFDLSLVGGWFRTVAYALPFAHAVDAARAAVAGDLGSVWPHLGWVIAYAGAMAVMTALLFRSRMTGDTA